MLQFITISIIFFAAVYLYVTTKLSYWSKKGVASFGWSLSLKLKHEEIYLKHQKIIEKYGKLVGYYEGFTPSILIADPHFCRQILVKDFNIFPNRRHLKFDVDEVSSDFIIFLGEEKWKRIRSVITRSFSTSKLRNMQPTISRCVSTFINNLMTFVSNNGEEMDVKNFFGVFSMEVTLSVLFGIKCEYQYYCKDFVKQAKKILQSESLSLCLVKIFPLISKLIEIEVFNKEGISFFAQISRHLIDSRIKNDETSDSVDFLQLFLNAHFENDSKSEQGISLNEIVSQCVVSIFASFDSISTVLSYLAYNLALYQDYQQKLYQEVINIDLINLDQQGIENLKYLDAIINENFRLYPQTVTIERMAKEDYRLGDSGIIIPAGMIVTFPVYAMHQDPDQFPNPEQFIPERFLGIKTYHPGSFLPFGIGPRACPAMRLSLIIIKFAIAQLVKNFQFLPSSNTQTPPETYCGQTGNNLMIPKAVTLIVQRRD